MTNDRERRAAATGEHGSPTQQLPILDWSLTAGAIPSSGRTYRWTAGEAERAAFVAELGLLACSTITGELEIKPLAGGRFRARGRAVAEISQACVVSLEPVASRLDEMVDVEFREPSDVPPPSSDLDLQDEVEIEPMEGDRLPLGKIVYDCLASAVDPYPRRPGAEFSQSASEPRGKDPAGNPFAALAKLKLDKSRD